MLLTGTFYIIFAVNLISLSNEGLSCWLPRTGFGAVKRRDSCVDFGAKLFDCVFT